jgi:hypothetical protein
MAAWHVPCAGRPVSSHDRMGSGYALRSPMHGSGLPDPPPFVLTTEVGRLYRAAGELTAEAWGP